MPETKEFTDRLHKWLHKPMKNTWMRSMPRLVRSMYAKEERENVRMLFRKFGVKYTKEKKRLRVAYNIPWGVDFDVRNPGACPQAGKWNGPLECFVEVWNSTPPQERADFLKVPYSPNNPVLNSNLKVKSL